jgi:hypothetical protein
MRPDAGPRSARRSIAWPLLGLLLAACAGDLAEQSDWSLQRQPMLLRAIQHYYQRFATEDRGRCRNVLMDAVTRSELVSQEQDRLVVNVRYRYRSTSGGERSRGCGGSGERTFEATGSGERYEILSMSGDRKEGVRWQIR